ncbi:MAG: hypothetical protein BJ554DRAFT_1146 [Olpidium bornovanus]|uniref:ERCC4 domain-containing protein n=1 Tax=Olpidium bornovanus TaxID=278681 RepID=A0A8H8DHP3_9FUNG|nr:MAG: hypothetical protein BJ554DRAFT_1146 [Olpidium bornovanus]
MAVSTSGIKEEKESARLRKAALSAANRRKTREEAVVDVIVEVDAKWKARSPASKELDALVDTLGCQMIEDANPPLPGLVRWRRKHTALWNKDENRFDPLPPDRCYVAEECFRALIIDGDEFAALCERTGPDGVGALLPPPKLEAHIAEFRACYPDGKLAYFIEGLEKYYRKVRSAENRRFTSAVRGTNAPAQKRNGSAGTGAAVAPDRDTVENALCWLQVFGKVKVVTSERVDETVAWFKALTRELAVLPVNTQHDRIPDRPYFCTQQGVVRSGATYSAVWQRCLEEVHFVTPAIVHAITRQYPTPRSLYEAFVECERQGGKPENVLADIKVGCEERTTCNFCA